LALCMLAVCAQAQYVVTYSYFGVADCSGAPAVTTVESTACHASVTGGYFYSTGCSGGNMISYTCTDMNCTQNCVMTSNPTTCQGFIFVSGVSSCSSTAPHGGGFGEVQWSKPNCMGSVVSATYTGFVNLCLSAGGNSTEIQCSGNSYDTKLCPSSDTSCSSAQCVKTSGTLGCAAGSTMQYTCAGCVAKSSLVALLFALAVAFGLRQ